MSPKVTDWLINIITILAAICAVGVMAMLSLKEGG
jgi:hypothetical protein